MGLGRRGFGGRRGLGDQLGFPALGGELGDPVGGLPRGRHSRAGGDAALGQVGHLFGQRGVAGHPLVDLGDGGRALGDGGLGVGQPGDRGCPLPVGRPVGVK